MDGAPTVAQAARDQEVGYEAVWIPDLLLGDGTHAGARARAGDGLDDLFQGVA
ncbi:hypothetical protein GCM10027569_37590 [Flindersiella endophytica]